MSISQPSRDEIVSLIDGAIANANLNTVKMFLEHPQLHARDRVQEVGAPNGPLMSFLPAISTKVSAASESPKFRGVKRP